MSVDLIKSEIAKLSRDQQAQVMHFLVDEMTTVIDDFQLSEAWREELDRREASLINGTSKRYTWQEVKAAIMDKKTKG